MKSNKMNADNAPAQAGKHTPGPWVVYTQSNQAVHVGTEHVGSGSHFVIADVMPHGTEKEANAALIASAPALLAALKKCNLEMRAMHSYYHSNCSGGCPFDDATNQALAAIKLVEGGK